MLRTGCTTGRLGSRSPLSNDRLSNDRCPVNTEVSSSGVRIGLRVEGAANPRAIVFVHGWAQSSRAGAPQLAEPALADRFRLVAMDLRGHGTSDVPAEGYDDPRN